MTLAEKLAEGERGALVPKDGEISGSGNSFRIKGALSFNPDTVRSALLLFDRLDAPGNNVLHLGPEVPPGLEDWPGLQRSHAKMLNGDLTSDFFQQVLANVFSALDDREDGLWSLARGAQSLGLPQSAFGERSAFKIRLENALPFPDRSVPYEDVLSYKARRAPELQSLRHHIEGLALAVERDGFGGLAETIEFEKFMSSLKDHQEAIRETNFLKRLFSLDVSFSWTDIIQAAAVQWPLVHTGGVSFGSFLASAGASLGISSTLNLKKRRKSLSPFEYVFRAHGEL